MMRLFNRRKSMTEFDDPQLVGMARILTPENDSNNNRSTLVTSGQESQVPSSSFSPADPRSSRLPSLVLPVTSAGASRPLVSSSRNPTNKEDTDDRATMSRRINSLRDQEYSHNNKSSNGKKSYSFFSFIHSCREK